MLFAFLADAVVDVKVEKYPNGSTSKALYLQFTMIFALTRSLSALTI